MYRNAAFVLVVPLYLRLGVAFVCCDVGINKMEMFEPPAVLVFTRTAKSSSDECEENSVWTEGSDHLTQKTSSQQKPKFRQRHRFPTSSE